MNAKLFWLLTAASGCTSASFTGGSDRPWGDDGAAADPALQVRWDDRELVPGLGAGYRATTPTITAQIREDATVLTAPGALTPSWVVALRTEAVGRPQRLQALGDTDLHVDGAWTERRHTGPSGLTEWTESTAQGVVHGYTVAEPPRGLGPLTVDLAVDVSGEVTLLTRRKAKGVEVLVDGEPRLAWTGLVAWDAADRPLDAWIELDPARDIVRVQVDDADAVYPVTIDPLITNQYNFVELETGVTNSGLGWAMAVDGDRIAATDPGPNLASAEPVAIVAYPWGQGTDAPWETFDELATPGSGVSIALEGTGAAVALADGRVATLARDAYAATWSAEETFTADSGCASLPQPCLRVAFDDERLLVASDASRWVKVYQRYTPASTATWGVYQTLSKPVIERFGSAVAADDGTLVIGAPGANKVYVYGITASTTLPYVEDLVLTDPDGTGNAFGATVAVSGSWIAVGAPDGDAVHLHQVPFNGGTVSRDVRIAAPSWASDRFGASIALHQTTLAVTDFPLDPEVAPRLYLYELAGLDAWSLRQVHELTPGLPRPAPVVVGDGMIAVGESHAGPPQYLGGGFSVWRRVGDGYHVAETVSGEVGDEFGRSLAFDDDGLVVGIPLNDVPARPPFPLMTDAGGLVRARREGDGGFSSSRTENPIGALSEVGSSIAVDGPLAVGGGIDLVRVTHPGENLELLSAADAGESLGVDFGAAVAIDSYALLIGMPEADGGRGAAAVFIRDPVSPSRNVWIHLTNIVVSDYGGVVNGDAFGKVVGLHHGNIYIGSESAAADGVRRGQLRLFRLDEDLVPYPVMEWSGTVDQERFASSLDIEGDRVAVGRRGAANNSGGVAILRGLNPVLEFDWDGAGAGDEYGTDVALAGDMLFVASRNRDRVRYLKRNYNNSEYEPYLVYNGTSVVDAVADMFALGTPALNKVDLYTRTGTGPPDANSDAITVTEGFGSVELDVLDNDLDPNGDTIDLIAVEAFDPTFYGHVTISDDDTLEFTAPDPDWDQTVVVSYTVSAGPDEVEANATFNVVPVNDCPVVVDDHYTTAAFDLEVSFDEVLEIQVGDLLANDTDVDTGDALTLVAGTPSDGTLTHDGDVLSFDPAGAVGEVTFSYTATDNGGCARTGTVTLSVTNEPPVVTLDPYFELLEDQRLVLTTPGLLGPTYVTDREDDTLTVAVVTPPERGTLLLSPSGSLMYAPAPEDTGLITFTLSVSDPYNTVSMTVTMLYTGVNDRPVAVGDGPFTTPEDRAILIDADRLLLNDFDIEDSPLVLRLDANRPPEPAGAGAATLLGTGNLQFTPAPDFAGTATVWYQASDLDLLSDFVPVEIVVEAVNDAPVATSWDYGEIDGIVQDHLLTPSTGAPRVVDADGDPLQFLLTNAPANGDVQLNGDGSFVYTPAPGFTGTDQFWYYAQDPDGVSSAPAKVAFAVFQEPLPGETPTTTDVASCPTVVTWYFDGDNDGFGTEAFPRDACEGVVLERYVAVAGDCDDTRTSRHPKAREIPGDGVDQNCDGVDNDVAAVGACSTGGRGPSLWAVLAVGLVALVRTRASARTAVFRTAVAAVALTLGVAAPAHAAEGASRGDDAAPVADAACPGDSPAEVERIMEALWSSFRTLDDPAFDRSYKALLAAIACLKQPPPPAQVARLHQAMSIATFMNGQTRACKRTLASVRLTDPSWGPPDDIFPPQHAFRVMFDAAIDPGPVAPIGKITPDEWLVDGVARLDAPTERAFLLQVRRDGQIVYTGYLWDFEEVPDFGQSRKRTALESPHQWWVGTSVHGGLLSSSQSPSQGNVVWRPQQGATFAGGAELSVRYTPITVVGLELTGSLVGPGDPVAGGGGLPSGQGVLLLGGAGWVGEFQPFAAARIGGGLDRVRSWRNAVQPDTVDVQIDTVPAAVIGIVGGVRSERYRGEILADGYLASVREPFQLRLRAQGGALVTGPLAIEGMAEARMNTMSYLDQGPGVSRITGKRENFDLRLGGTLSLWL